MLKRRILIILLILTLVTTTGCATEKNKDYDSFKANYYEIYLQVASSVNIKDTQETLKNLQSEENRKNIDKLYQLLEDIKSEVPESKKDHYNNLYESYAGLELLSNAYNQWNNMSFEQQANIWTEISLVNIMKDNILNEQKK